MRAAFALIIVAAFSALAVTEFVNGGDKLYALATACLGVANYILLVR